MRYLCLLLPFSLWAVELVEFRLATCELIFSSEVEAVEVAGQKIFGPAKFFGISCANQGEFFWFSEGRKVGYFCYGISTGYYLEEAKRLSLWQGPCLPVAENMSKWYRGRSECFGVQTKSVRCFYEVLPVTDNSFSQRQDKNILAATEVADLEIKAIYNHLGIRIANRTLRQLPQGLYFIELKNGTQKLLWRP